MTTPVVSPVTCRRILGISLLATLAWSACPVTARSQTLLSLVADASPYINTDVGFPPGNANLPRNGGDGVGNVGDTSLETSNASNQLRNAVFVFQLPNLGATANPFTSASFSATISSSSGASAFSYNPGGNNYDLFGLPARNSSTVLAGDFYAGPSGNATNASLIVTNFPGTDYSYNSYAAGTTDTTGNSMALVSYLNAQYAAGTGAGEYVFLRINSNFNPSSFSDLSFASGDAATNQPSLSFTTATVPEPSTWVFGALTLASAFAAGGRRFRHP